MSIKVKCSTCGARLKAPDAAAGRPLDCPNCAQTVAVPSKAAAPPRTVAGPGESSDFESHPKPIGKFEAPHVRKEFEELATEFEDRRAHRLAAAKAEDAAEADLPGAISLVLCATSVFCLVMGCLTFGLSYWVSAPLAVVGAGFAAYSHSRLRIVGLTLNLLALIPAAMAFRAAWTAAGMPETTPQPFLR
jgi:DNA-directed RNA polymerase subunit RPC12/RpoP